jgi:D-sedoheptulose 7-phosphate isomerase
MAYFPERSYPDAGSYADRYFELFTQAAATVDRGALSAAGDLLIDRITAGKHVYSCGNGGSAAIANHLVCDHMKGIQTNTSLRPKVHSFSATVELLTAIANDIGVEEMFAFQLSSLASEGDVLIAISSSGTSPNIVRVMEEAKAHGVATIAMTGFTGGPAATLADVSLHVDAHNYGVIEDVHQSLMHILAQHVRHAHLHDPAALGTLKF